jgi:RNA polymerase sigma-70 factor (ECF subfamily)
MKVFRKKVLENEDLDSILYKCSKGNRKAQEHLYKMHYSYALSIALRFSDSRETAAEILNDGFLKTFQFLLEGGKIDNLKPWLRKTIINRAIDHFRSEKKLQKHISYEEYLPEIELSDNIISNLTAGEILQHLQHLPDIYRLEFILFEIEGYSHKEISEKLGISEVSSRKNLSRAKAQLKNRLQKRGNYEQAG